MKLAQEAVGGDKLYLWIKLNCGLNYGGENFNGGDDVKTRFQT